MLKELFDTIPAGVAAAVLAWAGLSYAVLGPEIASRILLVDHLAACEAGIHARVIATAEEKIAAVPVPEPDPSKEMAAASLRQMANNPMMRSLRQSGLDGLIGIGSQTEIALQQYEAAKKRAVETYRGTVDRVKAETATHLASSGHVCGCIADSLVDETRTEWALFTGTASLVRPARIRDDALTARMSEPGDCAVSAGAAS